MQASKKIPFDDPMVLNGVRALYVLSNVFILGVYLYVKAQIDKKKGMFVSAQANFLRDPSSKPVTELNYRYDRHQVRRASGDGIR